MGRKNRPPVKKAPYERPERYNRKKDRRNKRKREPREPLIKLSQIPYAIIILAYVYIGTFTPNWMALDTNATKFMTLSLLNLLTFGYLLTRKDIRQNPGILQQFFDTRAGLIYAGFLLVTLLSFFKAINVVESVVMFSKIFTIFSAVFILSVILMRDIRYVYFIILVGTALLIFDSVSVYHNINKFIQREVGSISDIKSVYSNRNILSSALFVKIPFALWLWVFEKGWLKKTGLVAMAMGMLATFFMATRGFYVGLITVTFIFVTYVLYTYYREKQARHLRLMYGYIGALAFSLLIFSIIQSNLYPRGGRTTQAITTQIASIQGDASTSTRLEGWIWSLDLIKRNPVLGVGVGNWKINILEYENQTKTDYIYLYKAHNDFVEVTTETGIPGGVLYISLFLFIFWYLFRAYWKKETDNPYYKYLFLAGFGLLFYGFDGLFNFPIDRPEIQILFAIYLSVGIASAWIYKHRTWKKDETTEKTNNKAALTVRKPWLIHSISMFGIVMMLGVAWAMYQNFESSKLQRLIYQDIMRGKLDNDPDMFIAEFPPVPNLSVWGESITSTIARYLLQEGRHQETIDLLKDDHTNPFDGRREFFMATAYNNMGERDSALVYSHKVYNVKPYYFRNIHLLSSLLEQKTQTEEIGPMLDRYLLQETTDKQAYLFTTGFYIRHGELDKAWEHIEQAIRVFPGDSLINQQYQYVEHQKFILPHRSIYSQAARHYNNSNYERALPYLNDYIEKTPFDANVYRMRAFSNYHLGNHEECIEDIEHIFAHGIEDASLINLRGVCLQALGDQEAACRDFRAAMEKGNASGEQNYRNFCGGRE